MIVLNNIVASKWSKKDDERNKLDNINIVNLFRLLKIEDTPQIKKICRSIVRSIMRGK